MTHCNCHADHITKHLHIPYLFVSAQQLWKAGFSALLISLLCLLRVTGSFEVILKNTPVSLTTVICLGKVVDEKYLPFSLL